MPATLVLLHGFAGTGRAWDPVVERLERYTPLAPDLRGHGSARDARPITLPDVVEDVLALAPPRFTLCGYSMGGRIAFHVALAAPARIERLVLASTTAGIEDDEARAARRREDDALADRVEGATVEEFVELWMALPIFAGTPPEAARIWREDLSRNDPRAIAGVLRGLGGGAVPPVWDRLGELTMPTTVVAGARDAKYLAIGERLTRELPQAEPLVVVPSAGHGLPREAPAAVAAAIDGR